MCIRDRLITATLLSQIISFISFDRSNNFLQQMLGYNVEALAQDEGYNKGDKLKSGDVYKSQSQVRSIPGSTLWQSSEDL